MSKIKQPIETFLDPLKFYNHGDNPALKNFMKIALENSRDGKIIDHRTLMIDKGQKFFMARNWDDLLQRDFQATTFPKAFVIFCCNTFVTLAVFKWTKLMLPIGRHGIRKVRQTSFYHNFGPIGVAGAATLAFGAAFTQYKTFKFTLHKFYRHVLMGERNWFQEEKTWTSQYADYSFSDNLLGDYNAWAESDARKHIVAKKADWKPTYKGAYGQEKQ